MKKAEDSNALIFHFYEWAGKGGSAALRVPPGATGAAETNLLEKPEGAPSPSRAITSPSTSSPTKLSRSVSTTPKVCVDPR